MKMKKLLITTLLFLSVVLSLQSFAMAQTFYNYRYRTHATDCTLITDGVARDLCLELDSFDMYQCVPSAGGCDTVAEWKRTNNTAVVQVPFVEWSTSWAVGNGKAYFYVPTRLNGATLVGVHTQAVTVGTTGISSVQVTKCTAVATGNVCSGTTASMLSTVSSIDSGEDDTSTAATASVINGSNATVVTGNVIRVDIAAISTTAPKGGIITLVFLKQ